MNKTLKLFTFLVTTLSSAYALDQDKVLVIGAAPWDHNVAGQGFDNLHYIAHMALGRPEAGDFPNFEQRTVEFSDEFMAYTLENEARYDAVIVDFATQHHLYERDAGHAEDINRYLANLLAPNGKIIFPMYSVNFMTGENKSGEKATERETSLITSGAYSNAYSTACEGSEGLLDPLVLNFLRREHSSGQALWGDGAHLVIAEK